LKYDRINFSCPSILSLRNCYLPNTDPPIFGFLTARYANSMDIFSSSSWSYSSSDVSDDELYKYIYEMISLPLPRKKLAKNDGGRRRRIPCEQTSERLGGAMLTVGSTPWRRRCGEDRGEAPAARRRPRRSTGGVSGDGARRRRGARTRGDGEGRGCREEARARLIYGVAAGYRTRGGRIDRRRQNIAVAARGGGMEGPGARGKFQPVGHSRASKEMARATADASHLVLRIVQTPARPKKTSAPPRIQRAGGPIPPPRALYWWFFYRVRVIARLLEML
jgi:hypothetical protein